MTPGTTTRTGLAERIARCLPAGTFELETFVRIVGVEETTDVDTAAVTCQYRPRLRINPDFVARYCHRDEHLFLLVMHELWHVLLGHTTGFDQLTDRHNVAFDAVINAGLVRAHPQPEYRGFFEALNPADVFPHLLLRPPVGWPDRPDYRVPGPRGTGGVLRRLYPPDPSGRDTDTNRTREDPEPTYDELLGLLAPGPRMMPGRAGKPATAEPVLLGDHRPDHAGGDRMLDPLLAGVLAEVTQGWPTPDPRVFGGRGDRGQWRTSWIEPKPSAHEARSVFRKVLQRALLPDDRGQRTAGQVLRVQPFGRAPVPTAHDRIVHARRALGVPALLYDQRLPAVIREPEPPQRALVYLDVSGSMGALLPHLVDLLVPLVRRRLARVQQFSTVVEPLPLADLASGELRTTGGTAINCVLADAAGRPQRRIVLLTDGEVGPADPALLRALKDRRVEIHAALPQGANPLPLSAYATVTHLPRLS